MAPRLAAFIAATGFAFITAACGQTDAGITTSVKARMAADDTVKAYQLDVDTRSGVVTLSGDVDSAVAKARAVEIARSTEGVSDVIDQLRVDETAPTGGFLDDDPDRPDDNDLTIDDDARREGREAADRAGAAVTDAAVTSAVKAKFLADGTVRGLQIDVDTRDGVVTLNGTVASRAEADRAMMLARNTEGVKNVMDNLKLGR